MSDPLIGPMAKVERAKKHIQDLDAALRAFYATNPYVVGTKRNPDTRQLIYYVTSVANVPATVPAIAGDVIQNLRSALDHLAYQLVMAGSRRGLAAARERDIAFPIVDDVKDFESSLKGKVKGATQDAMDAIRSLKPYKGGNDTLWRIHRLNNIDKHRLLITVGSAFKSLDLGAHVFGLMKENLREMWGDDIPEIPHAFFRPADRLCPLKTGDELFIDAPDAKPNQDMGFRFDVAVSEPQIAESEPILETLHQMVDLVDNLLPVFRPLL